jgi:hypothetical protein
MLLTAMLSSKLAIVITSAVVAAGGLTGVGYAANDAAPGDALYGLDCAMESIGLGDGGLQERVREATELVERGETEKGLNHVAQAIQDRAGLGDSGQANGALVRAANALQKSAQTGNQGDSSLIQARVADMLRWMSANLAQSSTQGEEFGAGVTERAREIAAAAEQLRTQTQDQTQDQTRTRTQTETQSQDQTQQQSGTTHQNQNGEVAQSQSGQGSKGGK